MPQRLTAIRVPRVSFVERGAVRDPANPSEPRRFVMFKSEGSVPPNPTKGAPVLTDAQKAELDPAVREAVEKAEKETADAQAALEKASKETADEKTAREAAEAKLAQMKKEDPEPVKVDKSALTPEVRALLEKSEADAQAMTARLEKAEAATAEADKIAKAEREQRVTREYIAKAETGDLRGLPSTPADLGPVMKSLAEAAPEAWATFEKSVLVPAAAQIRESDLFKEAGIGGEGPPPDSALAKFDAKVTELRKADSSLSRSAAMERVRKEDPGLQQEMAKEMGTGADPSLRDPAYR